MMALSFLAALLFTGRLQRGISEPLLENPPPVEPYPVGSYGPESIKQLIAPYHWHLPHV